MSGYANADPAFMNNVPTGLSTTTTNSSTTSSSTSYSTSSTTNSRGSTSTSTSATASATATTTANVASSDSFLLQSVYPFSPSTAGAVAFSILYFFHIIYHFYLSIYLPHIRKSISIKHNYTIPLFIAALLSTFGFSIRIVSVASESGRASIGLYAASTCCLIVAPIFVCATLYWMVGHLIKLCLPSGPEQTFLGISPRWLGKVFITSDVLSFMLQGGGSAIATSGNWEGKSKEVGQNVLIVGLAMQLATFTIHMVVLLLFCIRVSAGKSDTKGEGEFRRRDGFTDGDGNGNGTEREFGFNPLVKQVVKGMWIASVLVEIRSIYRTTEFGMGGQGYLFRHEWPLWVFEAVPIWIALLVLGIYHPTKWPQQKRRSAFVHDKQVAEVIRID